MSKRTLADVDDRTLRAMIDLCPEKPGDKVSFSVAGRPAVELTYQSRLNGLAELKRRREAAKAKKGRG